MDKRGITTAMLIRDTLVFRLVPIGILALFCSVMATAEVLVTDFRGDPDDYQVEQSGRPGKIASMMLLEAGDSVRVLDADGAVTFEDPQGSRVTLTAQDQPFTVPEDRAPSWLGNLMREPLLWYRKVAGEPPEIVLAISRGEHEPPELRGMVIGENLIPVSAEGLSLFWHGGTAPFTVEVRGPGGIVWKDSTTGPPLAVPADILVEGRWHIRVSCLLNGVRVGDAQVIDLVPNTALPAGVRRIAGSGFAVAIRRRLCALALAQDPRWRFAALQLAVQAGDDLLQRALLGRHVPPAP